MTLATIAAPTPSALFTTDPEELGRIRDEAVNLCVWQRSVAPAVAAFIDRVLLPLPLNREMTAAADEPNLDALLDGIPDEEGCAAFRADIEALCRRYVRLTDATRISIKLQSMGEILCERFHTDWVRLRLICSYAGPGTQWLASDDADRRRLAPRCGDLSDEMSGLLRPGATVHSLDRFAVGLMKGERWPGNRGRGLVHRSPRIGDAAVRRVLLKIEGVAFGKNEE